MSILALESGDDKKNILNGDFTVSPFDKTLHFGGATFEYSGTHVEVETIKSKKTLRRPLDVLVGRNQTPQGTS